MDIQTLQQHIDNCANDVVAARDMCGDERAAMVEYQYEHGIMFSPIECIHISKAVEAIWSDSQQAAGVVAPLSTSERFDAYKALA
jgi:hypothetical protein